MAAPQHALAARAGSSEMEFLVRFACGGVACRVSEREAEAMPPCILLLACWLWHIV